MPFSRPNIAAILEGIIADLEADLPGADARLQNSVLNVLARAEAGAVHELHGFQEFVSRQVFPDSAETEFLDRWASVWGVNRKPARPASGTLTATGTNGSVIPEGSRLQRSDGQIYQVTAEAVIAAGTADVLVTAEVAGVKGNALAAQTLTLLSPIAGVSSAFAVTGDGLVQGSDSEADKELRDRLLRRIQKPPHGGAAHDYVGWALDRDTHGLAITRAWVYSQELGLGTVTVRFMMDDSYEDGIPLEADKDALQAYIDTVRPVTADVTVVKPISDALNFEISGLNPGNQSTKDAIEAELKDLIRREAVPGGSLLISHIREAISIAAGEFDHVLVSPAANVTTETGHVVTFGDITWS